jgi:TetR/AcrR family transcriptional regulator
VSFAQQPHRRHQVRSKDSEWCGNSTHDGGEMASRRGTAAPEAAPKQWEVRAALRVMARSGDAAGRSIAHDIVTAAWDIVSEGDHDFTVKQVSERADVALQTFYRHFGSKDELLLAMLEESISDGTKQFLAGITDTSPVERLHQLVTAPLRLDLDEQARRHIRWRARERQRLVELFPEAVEAVFEPYRTALEDAIVSACKSGDAASDYPALTSAILMHLVLAMTHAVHGAGLEVLPEQAAEHIWQLCWQGLGVRGDVARFTRERAPHDDGSSVTDVVVHDSSADHVFAPPQACPPQSPHAG